MDSNLTQKIIDYLSTNQCYNITFIGDSLTSCEWVHPNYREIIEYVLKQELEKIVDDWRIPAWKLRCFNAGFNGADSKDVLDMLENGILVHKPNLAFIMLGTNDADFHTASPREFITNIGVISEKLRTTGCNNIVLMSSPKTLDKEANEGYLPYFKKLEELANEESLRFIDLYKTFENTDLNKIYTFISPRDEADGTKAGDLDLVHPNMLGNGYIAKFLLKDVFNTQFSPEKYLESLLKGDKFPEY